MQSLQVKFNALVVSLLVLACLGLAWMATRHERGALEEEIRKRGEVLAKNLAGDAWEPLLGEDDLALDQLVEHAGSEEGLVGARLIGRDGVVVASLDPAEKGAPAHTIATQTAETPARLAFEHRGPVLFIAAPVFFGNDRIGEGQIEVDLARLVEPVVTESWRELFWLAGAVVLLGFFAGFGFVELLVRPLRRLRAGVKRISEGHLTTRVTPKSSDEVGELTRAFNEMAQSLQQKERIQKAFGRYASDYVLERLLQSPEDSELGGAEREITVLFADIRRFTRLSENMAARDVVSLLNEVFQIASDRILARSGTIDKFIGDAVMAYFGTPVPNREHALDAVRAAMDLQEALAERNAGLDGGGVRVGLGIGIHTGRVIVGTIGSDRRTDFTAIGDAVNVAHRLEKLAGPGEILVSEDVQRAVRGEVALVFEGERQLSGRLEPVHVYSVGARTAPKAAAGSGAGRP